jgi:hypothetical protein
LDFSKARLAESDCAKPTKEMLTNISVMAMNFAICAFVLFDISICTLININFGPFYQQGIMIRKEFTFS